MADFGRFLPTLRLNISRMAQSEGLWSFASALYPFCLTSDQVSKSSKWLARNSPKPHKTSKNFYGPPRKKHEYYDSIWDWEHNVEYEDYAIYVHGLYPQNEAKSFLSLTWVTWSKGKFEGPQISLLIWFLLELVHLETFEPKNFFSKKFWIIHKFWLIFVVS